MAAESSPDTAPIIAKDGILEESRAGPHREASSKKTLHLGEDIWISYSDNALVFIEKVLPRREQRTICGIPVGNEKLILKIPFYNILWVALEGNSVTIDYASISKNKVTPLKIKHALGREAPAAAAAWVEELLKLAYGQSQRRKRAKVLVNPHAGPGGAVKIWEHEVKPLFDAARMPLDITQTKFSGEAIGICEKLDIDAHDIVIPCSGDGLAYEVFNGLGKRPDARRALRQLAVAHIPCGSGNALSLNLNGSNKAGPAALAIIKGVRMPMDLMSVTHGDKRLLSFLSQSFGIIAECDLGTENMRWMGSARFTVGIVQRIFKKRVWPCEVSIKSIMSDKEEIKAQYRRAQQDDRKDARNEGDLAISDPVNGDGAPGTNAEEGLPPLKYGTVNDKVPSDWENSTLDKCGNFYCGNMAYMSPDANFFPAALPNDGLMDLVTNDGTIPVAKYVDVMTSVETGHYYNKPQISYRKIVAYRLTPKEKDGYISIDGERIPFEPFQVEIHPGLATVISKRGRYEADGPMGWEKAGLGDKAKPDAANPL